VAVGDPVAGEAVATHTYAGVDAKCVGMAACVAAPTTLRSVSTAAVVAVSAHAEAEVVAHRMRPGPGGMDQL
jgi:Iap family predicted aminopeptidase